MQKIIIVFVITVLCLGLELLFLKTFGASFVPNFVLIGVVFFNLYRGLNYSLGAAFLGGFLLDSYSVGLPGVNTFTLVLTAFLTGTLKKYIYQPGVVESRVLMVVMAAAANSFLQYFVNLASAIEISFGEALVRVILPEIILTALVASYTFERLKQCALRLLA